MLVNAPKLVFQVVDGYRSFEGNCSPHIQCDLIPSPTNLNSEYIGSMQNYPVSETRKPKYEGV